MMALPVGQGDLWNKLSSFGFLNALPWERCHLLKIKTGMPVWVGRERSVPLLIRVTFLSIFLEYSPKQSRKEAAKLYLSLAAVLAWG